MMDAGPGSRSGLWYGERATGHPVCDSPAAVKLAGLHMLVKLIALSVTAVLRSDGWQQAGLSVCGLDSRDSVLSGVWVCMCAA